MWRLFFKYLPCVQICHADLGIGRICLVRILIHFLTQSHKVTKSVFNNDFVCLTYHVNPVNPVRIFLGFLCVLRVLWLNPLPVFKGNGKSAISSEYFSAIYPFQPVKAMPLPSRPGNSSPWVAVLLLQVGFCLLSPVLLMPVHHF